MGMVTAMGLEFLFGGMKMHWNREWECLSNSEHSKKQNKQNPTKQTNKKTTELYTLKG